MSLNDWCLPPVTKCTTLFAKESQLTINLSSLLILSNAPCYHSTIHCLQIDTGLGASHMPPRSPTTCLIYLWLTGHLDNERERHLFKSLKKIGSNDGRKNLLHSSNVIHLNLSNLIHGTHIFGLTNFSVFSSIFFSVLFNEFNKYKNLFNKYTSIKKSERK